MAQRPVWMFTVKMLVRLTLSCALGSLKQFAPTLFTALIALHFPSVAAAAGSVRLAWDPSPDPSAVGYVVHYGTTCGNPSEHLDVGNQTSVQMLNLVEGVMYHFYVTAYSATRVESAPSNEVEYQVPVSPAGTIVMERGGSPGTAAQLRVTVQPGRPFEIQASEDLRQWTVIHSGTGPASGVYVFTDSGSGQRPRRFYRLAAR